MLVPAWSDIASASVGPLSSLLVFWPLQIPSSAGNRRICSHTVSPAALRGGQEKDGGVWSGREGGHTPHWGTDWGVMEDGPRNPGRGQHCALAVWMSDDDQHASLTPFEL